ncbi:hypothetical protein EIP91_003346 [Steccherinum ochraceum]|uniref:Protein kinase domain-containing protein n=1 Tax=Steccherinum ochraceum TaxID=92696 RepID=A0A4R0RH22_9APHY|nr:hypothetical protein EIP91_003346 [Steccherinum ochraceum]
MSLNAQNSESSIDLVFQRENPVGNVPLVYTNCRRATVDITTPRSRLPPPANLRLSFSLGQEIGKGTVGRVFEVNIIPSASSSRLQGRILPPLAVKICRRSMVNTLLPEAQNYVEMEMLQGHVIPRCYGLYSATIPDDMAFSPWVGDVVRSRSRDQHKLEEELLGPNVVTILLMERVGGLVPPQLFTNPSILPEIQAMYKDISLMGIYHADMAANNVVFAPKHPALPVRTSPHWTQRYQFRIIDFHHAFKVNLTHPTIAGDHFAELKMVLQEALGDLHKQPEQL